MHEVGIIQNTLAMAIETAEASGATSIHALRLRVGRLSGVVPDALEFAFEVVRIGTMAEAARLEIESVPAVCWCHKCQSEFVSDDLLGECPGCHEPSMELRRGAELELAAVEIS